MISDYMRKQNEIFHETNDKWGYFGSKWAKGIDALAQEYRCVDVLDFGAGKQNLSKILGVKYNVYNYDPGIPEISAEPCPADLVVCTHVLEHVEPELLNKTLEQIKSLTKKAVFISVDPGPSNKLLPDGKDSNLIQESISWWKEALSKYFEVVNLDRKEFIQKGKIVKTSSKEKGTFYGTKI